MSAGHDYLASLLRQFIAGIVGETVMTIKECHIHTTVTTSDIWHVHSFKLFDSLSYRP